MKTLVGSAIVTIVFTAAAHAQTDGVERLLVMVHGATISSPGGEEQRVGGGANPNETGQCVTGFRAGRIAALGSCRGW
jgi:hypothetical protein